VELATRHCFGLDSLGLVHGQKLVAGVRATDAAGWDSAAAWTLPVVVDQQAPSLEVCVHPHVAFNASFEETKPAALLRPALGIFCEADRAPGEPLRDLMRYAERGPSSCRELWPAAT
jgi:hypothetical protein